MRLQPQSGIYCSSNNQEVQLMTNQMKCVHNILPPLEDYTLQLIMHEHIVFVTK